MHRILVRLVVVVALFAGVSLAWAFSSGPPLSRTGAPGIGGLPAEVNCTVCHAGSALNDPAGEFDNLGATRRRGFDLEASVLPGGGWSAWVSWSHQRAVIRVPDPATPSQAGNEIDHVPRDVYTAGLEWAPRGGRWRPSA